jgi:TonB family protein
MLRLHLFLFAMCFGLASFGQSGLVNSPPIVVTEFDGQASEELILLPMNFDSDDWQKKIKTALKDKQVLIVSLIYTKFRTSPTFDQVALNRSRLKELKDLLPELFENRTILWRLIEQTSGYTKTEAQKLYHGFAINVRQQPTKETRDAEIKDLTNLKKLLSNPDVTDAEIERSINPNSKLSDSDESGEKAFYYMEEGAYKTYDRPAAFVGNNEALHYFLATNLSYPIAAQVDSIEGTVILSFEVAPNGDVRGIRTVATVSAELDAEAKRVMQKSPKWLPAKFNGVSVESNYTIPIVFDLDGDGKAETGKIRSTRSEFIPFGKDKTVTAVLDRNNWGEMAIVCDLTGSMSPYTSQLLEWFQKNSADPRIHSFTFFNDGDEKTDGRKKIGTTGGIYQTKSNNLDTVFNLITKTMNNGSGGDVQENNLEAALAAQSDCPNCDIVLISDNFATPRDLKLYDKISNPLHIIPCGAHLGLNLNYLMLAYQTNGTLHSLEDDLSGFDQMKDREIVDIGNDQFQLNNGRFIRLR